MEPLQQTGVNGIQMAQGDGVIHHCHPLLAAEVGDYQANSNHWNQKWSMPNMSHSGFLY
jgi:hypothetical protein